MHTPADHLVQQGLAHHRAGRLEEANRLYNQALALDRQQPDALHLAGLVALQSGRPQEAANLIGRAADLQPRNWAFRANLASALMQLNDFDGAHNAFRAASRLNPDDPQLQVGAANCMAFRGDFANAEAQLRKIVRRFPGAASAWFNLGNAVRDQGRLDEAAKIYARAVQLDEGNADARNNLGSALHSLQRFEEAEQNYRAAIALRPRDIVAHCNLASVLIDVGRFSEAENVARAALAIDPEYVPAHSTLAAALTSQGRLVDALPVYRASVALAPDDTRLLSALGSALFEAGLTAEGIELLERVQARQPDNPSVHQGLAWAYLATGDFARGWREYYHRPVRSRFSAKEHGITLATALPADLSGKRVCVLREQGLGDELFFARFATIIRERGASIAYRADARLTGMLRRNGLFSEVVPHSEPVPNADYYVLLGDLPLAVGAGAPAELRITFPPPLALPALDEALDEVRAGLAQLGPPPYLGLTWRGGIAPEQNRSANWAFFKQIPLTRFAAAFRSLEGTLLVLQRAPHENEIEELARHAGRPVHDLSALNEDLEKMLALLSLIDDYIGVSNTNMHLRAGVGKSARVLVPAPAEWRWMAAGDESPWFPGFRVYRQMNDGDWSPALAKLRGDIAG